MKGFYERHRDELEHTHKKRNGSHLYPSHFHQNVEIFILLSGDYYIMVNGEKRELSSGDILFIDSYDIHEYPDERDCESCVIILPYHLMSHFNRLRANRIPTESVIHSPKLTEELIYIVDTFLDNKRSDAVRDDAAELILSLIYSEMEFKEYEYRSEVSLMRKILFYIQDNYRGDINRNSIAHALGYTAEHISRVFNKHLHRSLNDYINSLRLTYVEYRLTEALPPSLTDLIYEAGFNSEQTYYRTKRKKKKLSID